MMVRFEARCLCVPIRPSLVLCELHRHGLDHDLALGKEILDGFYVVYETPLVNCSSRDVLKLWAASLVVSVLLIILTPCCLPLEVITCSVYSPRFHCYFVLLILVLLLRFGSDVVLMPLVLECGQEPRWLRVIVNIQCCWCGA